MSTEMPTDCERPSLLSSLRELGTPLELLRFPLRAPELATAPRGDGRQIVLLPGFTAPELSMQPLALYLKYLGYDATTWGILDSSLRDEVPDKTIGGRISGRSVRFQI